MSGGHTIPQLIINSPFTEPAKHWHYDRTTRSFSKPDGRRPAGYIKATEHSKAFDDPGIFVELPLANQIRPRVKAWREAGYPGVTGITRRLLAHWYDREARPYPLFFCQLEAIETLIWLAEAPASERQGLTIPGDGGPFTRLCAKMATGSGKTIVMAMLIAWQVLNKVTFPQDKRFSKHVFVVAPDLTVSQCADALQVLLEEKARGIMTRPQLRRLADQWAADIARTQARNRRASRAHRRRRLRVPRQLGIKCSKLPCCDAKLAL